MAVGDRAGRLPDPDHAPGPARRRCRTSRCSTRRWSRRSRWPTSASCSRRRPSPRSSTCGTGSATRSAARRPGGAGVALGVADRRRGRPWPPGRLGWDAAELSELRPGPGRRRRHQPHRRGEPVGARPARATRTPGELVGQRLISIIPTRFHQAHIAGFTLHLVNGRSPLIGNRVTVPVTVPTAPRSSSTSGSSRSRYPTAGGSSPPSSSPENRSSSSASSGSRRPTQSSAQKGRSRPAARSSTPRACPGPPPGTRAPGSAATGG